MGKNAKDAVPALTQVLQNDQYPSVRTNAAGALKEIGTLEATKAAESAVPALIQALQSEYRVVRANAAGTLKAIGTPEALKALKGYSVERWKSK